MRLAVVLVAAVALLAAYAVWTAGRIERLHARVDAAWAALDAQLVRRAAAARTLAGEHPDALGRAAATTLHDAAQAALDADAAHRESVENDLSRALQRVGGPVAATDAGDPAAPVALAVAELRSTVTKVGFARQFHNDAVRDTRSLRGRRLPRLLRLAPDRPAPGYFEIDDSRLPAPAARPGGARSLP